MTMNATLEQLVIRKTRDALDKVADNPHVAFDTSAVRTATAAVVGSVAPIIDHATNAEPWYRSRVTWGAILAALAGVLGAFGVVFDVETQGRIVDLAIALGPVIGAGIALYGRWVAKKPLGQ